ncbi:MAG: hypothetical protein H6736_18430 [Alphaproteobacteria bacterium]|nr:hypothetical protein [Alphaproteobacteria bacterium]MCB9693793.1 hypothetical protein [Alphaproteobacteria bacterium]
MFARRQVTVKVGAKPRKEVEKVRPRLVFPGVVPFDAPWLVERHPEARVRDSRYAPHRLGVEHLRFQRGHAVGALPGLEHGSLLRDSVALALASGCPSVDVLLAHVEGGTAQDLTEPRALDLLTRALGEVPGTVVVFPDAPGLPDVPRHDLENLVRVVQAYGPTLSTHFQVGVADLPLAPEPVWRNALRRMRHHDVCLAAWTGPDHALDQHGWRCASAWLGGRIAGLATPMESVVGATLEIPGGRVVPRGRHAWLGRPPRHHRLPDLASGAVAELRLHDGRVTIGSEPTLREPVGAWDVPLLRTSKILHQRLVITANLFVFREATEANAILLQQALQMALEDFVRRDVVGGPESDRPQVHCIPDRNPAQPALIATVRAFLKPWVREMRLELAVRPGEAVVLEVA